MILGIQRKGFSVPRNVNEFYYSGWNLYKGKIKVNLRYGSTVARWNKYANDGIVNEILQMVQAC